MIPGIQGIHPVIGASAAAASGGTPPAYQNNGGLVDNGSSNGPISVPYPSGLQPNDIAFLHATILDSINNNTVDTPSGWTLVDQKPTVNPAGGLSGQQNAIFWKRLTGAETGSVSTDCSAGIQATDTYCAVISIHRGCVASGTPYEALGGNAGQNASPTGASVTTTGPNRTILNFVVADDDTLSTPAAGWTEQYDLTTLSGSTDGAIKLYSITQATAGVVAGVTHSLAASERWQVMSLALIPA